MTNDYDIVTVIALAESTLADVAKQASQLATGLQNVAPTDKNNAPNKSMLYLGEAGDAYADFAEKCRSLIGSPPAEQKEQLQAFIKAAVQFDKELREKYQIADKFRFIRERLEALEASVTDSFKTLTPDEKKHKEILGKDEMLVYVYLFNAHGMNLTTWPKFLTPAIFYEHSVNRPVYIDKNGIESFIRRKQSRVQHGYITVIIKNEDVSKAEGAENLKDTYGSKLIKVKEGALKFDRMITFSHNEIEYTVTEEGQLIRKLL